MTLDIVITIALMVVTYNNSKKDLHDLDFQYTKDCMLFIGQIVYVILLLVAIWY